MQCATSRNPLFILVNGHNFVETVWAIPGLIYPLVVRLGWWREKAIRIRLEDNLIQLSSFSGCGSIPLLTDVSLSETMSMVAVPKKDKIFLLPATLGSYCKAFDPVAATALSPHLEINMSFKLTVDLIMIDCPLYPLTEKYDAALGTCLYEMLVK